MEKRRSRSAGCFLVGSSARHVIEERRRELFLEGHRFFDIRRLNLPLDPAPGTAYRKGGLYGENRCFPLPDVERFNNPSFPKA
jgi:hypothetical protein